MKKKIIRLCVFLLGLIWLVAFANTFLIKTDPYARLTLAEMKQRDDIQLAFVGSSVVRDHFNAEMISEQTGLTSFSVGIPCAALQADLAVTKELYRTNSPEWTILVVEPFTFNTVREGIEAQYDLMPYLSSPPEQLKYYLRLCREDGWYFDRLFMFRDFGVTSFSDFLDTVGLHFFPWQAYESMKHTLDKRMTYAGSGFVRYNTKDRATKVVRQQIIREYTGYEETKLTGWQTEGLYICEPNAMQGKCLRVYARPQGSNEQGLDVFFDFHPGKDDEPCLQI